MKTSIVKYSMYIVVLHYYFNLFHYFICCITNLGPIECIALDFITSLIKLRCTRKYLIYTVKFAI